MTDGGSAFPNLFEAKSGEAEGVRYYDLRGECGMTLRDYFAAKALQGILANPQTCRSWFDMDLLHIPTSVAYQYAEAMLKARRKLNECKG